MDFPTLLDTLSTLLRLPREQATVEFKSNLDDLDDIGQYLSAMANTAALQGHDRAWVVWGVADGSHAVTGTSFDPFKRKVGNQALVMWLQTMTQPRADFASTGARKCAASSRPNSSSAARVTRPCLVTCALFNSVSVLHVAASVRMASCRPASGSLRNRNSVKCRRAAATASRSRSASVAPGTTAPDQSSFKPSRAHSRASLPGWSESFTLWLSTRM